MNILIFGGGGFIGSAISDRLLLDSHRLRIFDRPSVPAYRNFGSGEIVEWVTGDIMSAGDVSKAMEGIDVVLHLVSTTLPQNSNEDPIFDVKTNLVASLQILTEMEKQNIQKIIFISSGGTVYGNPIYCPIDENHPTNPTVSYGIIKLTIEKYLMLYENLYGIKSITLRVANPFGERQRLETAQGAVGVFLNKAIRNEPITIWGDGSVVRDFIYISDVADAFAKAIYYTGPKNVFNISSGQGTSINALIDLIEEILPQTIQRNYLSARPYDVPLSVLDNSLAGYELGWSPQIDLRAGLVRTASWMKRHLDAL